MQEAVPRTVETYVTRDGKDVFQGWLDGLADGRARVLVDKAIAIVDRESQICREGVQEFVLDYGPVTNSW